MIIFIILRKYIKNVEFGNNSILFKSLCFLELRLLICKLEFLYA